MTTLIRRRGADWVHVRSARDTPATFAHTLCGLSFTTADLYTHPGEEITCPQCLQQETLRQRMELIAAAPMTFKPKIPGTAAAWAGPHVEILVSLHPDSGAEVVAVFLDGQEVPYTHLNTYIVDPGAGHERDEWDADTADVAEDVTMTSLFRQAVVDERNSALDADRGRYIEGVL